MRRMLVIILLLCSVIVTVPVSAQSTPDGGNRPSDLAAIVLPPAALPEPGFQLSRAGYLTLDDARYLIGQDFSLEIDTVADEVETGRWQQGYVHHLVLLEDRTYRTSTPLAAIETTILAFVDDASARSVEHLLAGAHPANSEARDPAVEGATTKRVVTSQDDRLVTVVRSGSLVFEIVSADATGTPDAVEHEFVVETTLERAVLVRDSDAYGLSHQVVSLDDDRLVPLSILPESPLVHDYYRLLDGQVIPVAGELLAPELGDLPEGAEQVVAFRQTAELASQTWLTAGMVVLAFDDDQSAGSFAEDGLYRDPLDLFAVDEDASAPVSAPAHLEVLTGESSTGGRYSGYRLTVQEGSLVAQLTLRVIGRVRLDQQGAEQWAEAQATCLGGGSCASIGVDTLLATHGPAMPDSGAVERGSYQSSVAPWSVTFDPDTWTVEETVAEGGYDYLYLRSERMDASFETVVDHRGDPEQCVLNELDRLREVEAHANITIGSDDPAEQPGGLETGHGWVVYTVEPLEPDRSLEEYTLRIDCYVVVEDTASLVVQVRAPRDAWADMAPNGEVLRGGIEIELASVGRFAVEASNETANRRNIPRRAVMPIWTPWLATAAA